MLLSCRSSFFRHLFSGRYSEDHSFGVGLPNHFSIVVDILLNYGMMGVVVVPVDFTAGAWMELAELAEYFCMEDLLLICESQLCSRLEGENHQELEVGSRKLDLNNLSLHCANYELRHSLRNKELKRKVMKESREGPNGSFMKLFDTLRFDLFHNNEINDKEPVLKGKKSSESETTIEEKENNREYTNA